MSAASNALEERRLKVVYDELDHGRPKAALAELQKYLKKAPQRNGTPLVEALRCLSLQRLGQIDEAYETFLKLASEGGQFAADKGTLTSTPAPATKLKVIKGKNGKVIKKPAPAAAKSEAAAPAKEPEAPPLPSASTSKQPAERKWKDLPENILFTLGHALKPMGKFADLQALYAHAWSQHTDNLDLGAQAFMLNLRQRRFHDNQTLALKLYQLSEDPKCARWAAMCTYLEAVSSETTSAERRATLLDLAKKILQRAPSTPYDSQEVLLLYIDILRGRGHAQGDIEALEILTPDLPIMDETTRALPEDEKAQRVKELKTAKSTVRGWLKDLRFQWQRWTCVEALAKRQEAGGGGEKIEWDWAKEWERCDDAIRGAEDVPETNYKAYLVYLDVLSAIKSISNDFVVNDKDYLAESRETLIYLTEKYGASERAPLLAHLELLRRFSLPGRIELLRAYWKHYGHKGSFVEDVQRLWPRPEDNDFADLERELLEFVKDQQPDLRSFQRRLNAQKILRRSQKSSEVMSSAKTLFERYLSAVSFGDDVPDTDVKPADDLALMAAQELVSGWAEDGGEQWLILAALVLLAATGRSPANGEVRLLLVQVYRLLGVPSLILHQLEALKMRTFQQDTVLHVVVSRASSDALIGGIDYRSAVTRIILQRRQMYTSTNLEVGDALGGAFANEAYSQVAEMLALDEKLANSFQRAVGELELVRQSALNNVRDLVDSLDDAASNLRAYLDRTQDIRDFDLLPNYASAAGNSEGYQNLTVDAAVSPGWVRSMASAWLRVLEPKSAVAVESANDVSTLSSGEKALLTFAHKLGGELGATDVTLALNDITSTDGDKRPSAKPYGLTLLLEAIAMLEVAIVTRSKSSTSKELLAAARDVLQEQLTQLEQTEDTFAKTLHQALIDFPMPEDSTVFAELLKAGRKLGRDELIEAMGKKLASLSS